MSVDASPLSSMNVDDLEWRASTLGGLSPRSVSLLMQRGHLDLVIQAAVERGEWFCAKGATGELCRAGEFERALEVVEPSVTAGRRAARWAKADVLLLRSRSLPVLDDLRSPTGASQQRGRG
jgi:hypothetical protein